MQKPSGKPDWVTSFDRPSGTEIKCINGNYYLYERKSVYDPVTKKKRKKSGAMIGKLTPDGFVPKGVKIDSSAFKQIENLEYGSSVYLYESSQAMIERLKLCFPHRWKEVFAMAYLRCTEQSPFKRMGYYYSTSYLSQILGKLSLSPASISNLLKQIGTDRGAIRQYMQADLDNSGIIMIDGHRIITHSENLEFARLGYDSKMRYLPQINLIYLFQVSEEGRLPVYYKQFSGDVPDVSTFDDILHECKLAEDTVTLIADKGFGSDNNFAQIVNSHLSYIIPLKRNTTEVSERPETVGGYDQVFNYRGHPIYAKTFIREGYQVYLFNDTALASNETADLIDRLNKQNATIEQARKKEEARRAKGKGKLSDEKLGSLKPLDLSEVLQDRKGIGTFVLQTNRGDLNCQQVHLLYKTRQEIEQTFKSYDTVLDSSASYLQDLHALEAWLFINHLALQMLYGILDRIAAADLTGTYSFNDMISYLRGIRVNRINNQWYFSKVTKKTKDLCQKLELDLKLEGTL